MEKIGHRGARGLFPENTLEGFLRTAALGVDGIEIDIAMTADDAVVVSHDPALNPDLARGPDGAWLGGAGPRIRELTRAELARFDVGRIRPGSHYAALYPKQQPIDGAHVPSLAETLAALPAMRFTLELKTFPDQPRWTAPPETMAEAVLAVIEAADAQTRVVVQSFDWRGPRHLRRLQDRSPASACCSISWAWLTSPSTVAAAALWWNGPTPADFGGSVPQAVAAEGAGDIWAPAYEELTQDQVAEAQNLGLRVVPWTVNRCRDMARLMAWGVDGIITDRPDLFPAAQALAPS